MKAFPEEVRLVERARERVGMALRVRLGGGEGGVREGVKRRGVGEGGREEERGVG